MLSLYEFEALTRAHSGLLGSQRKLADDACISLGSANKAIKSLRDAGYLSSSNEATAAGEAALDAYRVNSVVILAAGMGTRIAPLSFEKPKALLTVQGEVLIERQIRQIREAGIRHITVVTGYMRESLFYLKDEFGVDLVFAPDYAERNNHASLVRASDSLGNSFIVSGDQYFRDNPFRSFMYESSCVAVQTEGDTRERILETDKNGYVTASHFGGGAGLCAVGPVYLEASDSQKLVSIIREEYDLPETKNKFWEQFLLERITEFPLKAQVLPEGAIWEFDSYEDLCSFDADFFLNVDSRIVDNICRVVGCERSAIAGVSPIKEGISNLSFLFTVDGEGFVYRHPGSGTNEVVNREAESYSLGVAKELGLDHTFLYEDTVEGWKISRYIPGCRSFDYGDGEQVRVALGLARSLHQSGKTSPWSYEPFEESEGLVALLKEAGYPLPENFSTLSADIRKLSYLSSLEDGKKVLCHNDFYGPNLLVHDGGMELIDWEYSAMSDYACDIGNFVAQGSGYSVDEAINILPLYFEREPTALEVRHCMAYVAIIGYYWYVWAMYKESQGDPTGPWLEVWYQAAKQFGDYALGLYGEPIGLLAQEDLTRERFDELVEKQRRGEASLEEMALLEPYRARRAVLLASGFGSRMLPITINTPKPLVRVRGRRIIETIIDSLLAIGVTDIVVVRGYLADEFDVLLKKYPMIRFVTNHQFDSTNNISSALAVLRDDPLAFQNAYVVESDLLLTNPDVLSRYQWRSNYLGVPVAETPDWCFEVEDGKICDLHKGGTHCFHMFGISYWNGCDGKKLAQDIEEAFQLPANRQRFWDDVPCVISAEHYEIDLRECTFEDVTEIDSFAELCSADPSYDVSSYSDC